MTKATFVMTICGVLVMAGCVDSREPSTVRSGPQAESPIADAPGGKLPIGTAAATRVIIDDSTSMVSAPMNVASPAVTTAPAQTNGSIFEFTR
ncbi:hypothetical protein [Yoonia sp. MH D7]